MTIYQIAVTILAALGALSILKVCYSAFVVKAGNFWSEYRQERTSAANAKRAFQIAQEAIAEANKAKYREATLRQEICMRDTLATPSNIYSDELKTIRRSIEILSDHVAEMKSPAAPKIKTKSQATKKVSTDTIKVLDEMRQRSVSKGQRKPIIASRKEASDWDDSETIDDSDYPMMDELDVEFIDDGLSVIADKARINDSVDDVINALQARLDGISSVPQDEEFQPV